MTSVVVIFITFFQVLRFFLLSLWSCLLVGYDHTRCVSYSRTNVRRVYCTTIQLWKWRTAFDDVQEFKIHAACFAFAEDFFKSNRRDMHALMYEDLWFSVNIMQNLYGIDDDALHLLMMLCITICFIVQIRVSFFYLLEKCCFYIACWLLLTQCNFSISQGNCPIQRTEFNNAPSYSQPDSTEMESFW